MHAPAPADYPRAMPTQVLPSRARRPWLALVGWIALAQLAGVIGSIASIGARAFYADLVKPAWAPPGGVFGPVWITLYTLMGIAAWWVWRERDRAATRTALTLFVVQLVVNAGWSWAFFRLHNGGVAFAWIAVLCAFVIATMLAFARVRRAAAWLLAPYLAWIVFAAALNFAVWQANPSLQA